MALLVSDGLWTIIRGSAQDMVYDLAVFSRYYILLLAYSCPTVSPFLLYIFFYIILLIYFFVDPRFCCVFFVFFWLCFFITLFLVIFTEFKYQQILVESNLILYIFIGIVLS